MRCETCNISEALQEQKKAAMLNTATPSVYGWVQLCAFSGLSVIRPLGGLTLDDTGAQLSFRFASFESVVYLHTGMARTHKSDAKYFEFVSNPSEVIEKLSFTNFKRK